MTEPAEQPIGTLMTEPTKQPIALLPCPFCGSHDVMAAFWDTHSGPGCNECGAYTDTDEGWNRRAQAPQAEPTQPVAWICADDYARLLEVGEARVYQEKQTFIFLADPGQWPLYSTAPQAVAQPATIANSEKP